MGSKKRKLKEDGRLFFALTIGLVVGIVIGMSIINHVWRGWCIEEGYVHYHHTTGKLMWGPAKFK